MRNNKEYKLKFIVLGMFLGGIISLDKIMKTHHGLNHILPLFGIEKFIGLMFRKNPSPVIIKLKKERMTPIHSMFVRVSFIAIWLDKDDRLIDAKLIKPWTRNISPPKPFKTLIELPI